MVKRPIVIYIIALAIVSGCSMFRAAPDQSVKGDKVVLALYKETQFKNEVIKKLTESLPPKGYQVITGSNKQAKYYKAADYGAVVYMAEYWARHVPWHAKKYFNKFKEARNIVFVVTSGDPDVKIKKPFDAVTTASKDEKVDPVAQEILKKLEGILR
ncbi:MAG: hypothetical protein JXB48_02040 [Candidatus Latescibacteria bacterium]|nr:hypothetical protein [Candidatus Latescibacterota bacterium]